jgi:hypothetical protein
VSDRAVAATRPPTLPAGLYLNVLAPEGSKADDVSETAQPRTNEQSIRVAQSVAAWAAKCDEWYRKAKRPDVWFTPAEKREFDKTETKKDDFFKQIPGCKAFADLQSECQSITAAWADERISAKEYVAEVQAKAGCVPIVGYDNVCNALEEISKKGIKLNDNMKALMVNCIVTSIRNERVPLLRPLL